MARTRSMTRNQNHDDDASSKKKVNTGDNGGVGPWSDLNHHLLYLVMIHLGVVDYLSFGCVCKSWRSLAISNRNMFMASKPPMPMRILSYKKGCCYLEDFEGREFKTMLPGSVGGAYVGLTCGYLIFFKRTTCDFWLVNPITRHGLYFTDFPIDEHFDMGNVRAILVFSVSMVLLVMCKNSTKIWFSIAGTGAWNHVSCINLFTDVRAFKGTIYTLNHNPGSYLCEHVYELRLNPKPKLTKLRTKNSLTPSYLCGGFVSHQVSRTRFQLNEMGYARKECGRICIFSLQLKEWCCQYTGVGLACQYGRHAETDRSGKRMFIFYKHVVLPP